MGLFTGSRPTNLGFRDGKFSPPSWKPNCVSSTVDPSDGHYIEPLPLTSSPPEAWQKLRACVRATPRVTVITDRADYLYAEFKSAAMGFVDDVEFAPDETAGVIHVRSASRLGVRDFCVNRKRIETIRAQLAG